MTHQRPALAVLLVTASLAGGCGRGGNTPVSAPEETKIEERKPELSVSDAQLAKDFVTDQKTAEAKYKGKVIEVEGTVFTANRIVSERDIILVGYGKSERDLIGANVHCRMLPQVLDEAFLLGEGQKVKVVGKVVAGDSDVFLDKCSFVELSPNLIPRVTAEEIVREYAKDPEAARQKYSRELIVEGIVSELTKEREFCQAYLECKPPLRVACTVFNEDFPALKKGQQVRLKGRYAVLHDNTITIDGAFVLKAK